MGHSCDTMAHIISVTGVNGDEKRSFLHVTNPSAVGGGGGWTSSGIAVQLNVTSSCWS
jgi:hypothetical protein